jgi:hypothetical protein
LTLAASARIRPGVENRIHLVVDDFGSHGQSWRETNVGDIDLETVINDLLEGAVLQRR